MNACMPACRHNGDKGQGLREGFLEKLGKVGEVGIIQMKELGRVEGIFSAQLVETKRLKARARNDCSE